MVPTRTPTGTITAAPAAPRSLWRRVAPASVPLPARRRTGVPAPPRRRRGGAAITRAAEDETKSAQTKVKDPDYAPKESSGDSDARRAAKSAVTVTEILDGNTSAYLQQMAGSTAPMGSAWDPFGLTSGKDIGTLKRYRESEITHGRVCMLASVGILAGENFAVVSDVLNSDITSPAIYQFQNIRRPFWELIVFAIGLAETTRAQIGWMPPNEALFDLRKTYEPGDLGWDPLGLRPGEPTDLQEMKNKELNNGRLAMIGTAGMVVQELVDGQNILPLHGGLLG